MKYREDFQNAMREYLSRYPVKKYIHKYPDIFSIEFEQFCDENIVPIYERYMRFIKSTKAFTFNFVNILLFLVPMGIISMFVFINLNNSLAFLFVFLVVIVIGGIGIPIAWNYSSKQEEKRKRRLKIEFAQMEKEIFPVLFSYGGEIEYISSLSEKENLNFLLHRFYLGQLRGGIDVKYRDDFFKIKYKNFEIDVREVFLKEFFDNSQGDTCDKKGGHAIVFSIKTFKSFSHRTAIIRRIIEQKRSLPEKFSNYEDVILENSEFNEMYRVLTTSQQEARLFITPAFMTRLLELTKKYPKLEIDISFERDNINILFCNDEDKFELFLQDGLLACDTPVDKYDYEIYRTILIDLKESLSMLDELQIKNIL